MKTNEEALYLIKKAEGLRVKAYLCPAGVPTIGYGSTFYPDGTAIHIGDTITESQAESFFHATLSSIEKHLLPILTRELNQNQFSALVSFTFNLGIGAFKKSTLLKKVNANRWDPSIRDEFHRWVHASGKVLPGLVTRRKAEANLYFKS